jgi:site-specific DNA-methyltransferase (adenine-specific)
MSELTLFGPPEEDKYKPKIWSNPSFVPEKIIRTSEVFLEDCKIGMKKYRNRQFDLAVVDPPYGIDMGNFKRTHTDASGNKYHKDNYSKSNWDEGIPDDEYFKELFRISKNQIIWGGNYFDLPPTQCFIFWYKRNPVKNFSDGEYAWTSFDRPALCFDYPYYGNVSGKKCAEKRIHPTQKPIELYRWIYEKFSKKGQRIIDTHLGSGSSRIAADMYDLNFTAYETNEDYFRDQDDRYNKFKAKISLF